MSFDHEKRQALQLLQGIENGTLSVVDAGRQMEKADPALVYFIVTWLRSRYGGDHPAAEGVVGRLVELTGANPTIKAQMREGKADAIVTWFEESHEYRELGAPEFVDLVVEKLEG